MKISEEEFQAEINKNSKYWNVDIYNPCLTCGKLTTKPYCKDCIE